MVHPHDIFRLVIVTESLPRFSKGNRAIATSSDTHGCNSISDVSNVSEGACPSAENRMHAMRRTIALMDYSVTTPSLSPAIIKSQNREEGVGIFSSIQRQPFGALEKRCELISIPGHIVFLRLRLIA